VKLFSYSRNNQLGIGVDTGEDIIDLTPALDIYQKAQGVKNPVQVVFLQMLVEMGYCSEYTIQHIIENSWVQAKLDTLRLEPGFKYELPVARPSKLICLGRNYVDHVNEFKGKLPAEPLFFAKASSSLIAHKDEIIIPSWLTERVDHEAELAFIIGKVGRNIPESEAMSYIAGFTIINDITARKMQHEDMKEGNPWFRSKSIDTFCPCGPCIVPVDSITNPHNLNIELKVNGETRQKANTKDMIFTIPVIIAYISKYMTLQPGDIISTGTPAGVSGIKSGDEIEISIEKIGTLKNNVINDQ